MDAAAQQGGRAGGAGELRRLRFEAGLTQEQLAGAADLHVRTVRGLESGATARPHRVSMELIARALELDAVAELRFFSAWGIHDRPTTSSALRDARGPAPVRGSFITSCRDWQALALRERISVNADRFVVSRHTHEVVQALGRGLATRRVLFDFLDDPVSVADVQVVATENCVVESVRTDPVARTIDVVFGLGHRHAAGDVHSLGYRLELATEVTGRAVAAADLPQAGTEVGGFVHPPASYVLQVGFAPEAVPASIEQVFQPAPGAPMRSVRELSLSACDDVSLALAYPHPGGHGLSWRWGPAG